MAKILLIVAIVISLITAGLGYMNRTTLQTTRDELETSKSNLTKASSELAGVKKELTTLKTTVETTNGDLAKATQDLAAAKTEVENANKAAADAKAAAEANVAQIQTLTEENEQLKAQLAQNGGSAPVAPGGPSPREQELEALVASQNEKIKAAEDQLAGLKQREEQRQKNQMKQGLEGRVLAVNPAWNFVVLSIGDRQGVVNNAEMLLKRGGQYLGKVRITSVEPSTSIADIVANSLPSGVAVQPGDSVIFQGSN